jgi:hypothetical protein
MTNSPHAITFHVVMMTCAYASGGTSPFKYAPSFAGKNCNPV